MPRARRVCAASAVRSRTVPASLRGLRVVDRHLRAVDHERHALAVGRPRDLAARSVAERRDDGCSRPQKRRAAAPGRCLRRTAPRAPRPRVTCPGRDPRRHAAPRRVGRPRGDEERAGGAERDAEEQRRDQRGASRAAQPWMAQSFERTLRVSLLPAEAAGVHHADVADREIEAHGIGRDRASRSDAVMSAAIRQPGLT